MAAIGDDGREPAFPKLDADQIDADLALRAAARRRCR